MSEVVAVREAYGKALAEFGKDNDFVVMDADLSGSTKTKLFANVFPNRFLNAGIAEGNMISTAAGIATTGKTVFASSFAMFATGRAFEQIRNSVCYPNLNVKIAATHSGISVGEDGASHQAIEDISIMRSIPNMTIVCPADAIETKATIKAAIDTNGPFYIRLSRLSSPVVFDENYKFELGKGILVSDGSDITLISTGIILDTVLKARDELLKQGIKARVINMHTIKPIDKDIIIKSAKETKGIVTIEEHSIIGGLGSAVAEVLSENSPAKLKRVGINDVFGQSGKPNELFKAYGLTVENIVNEANNILK